MKINITKELTLRLLNESASFRQWAADQIEESFLDTVVVPISSNPLRKEVLEYMTVHDGNKIGCIKHLRDTYNGHELAQVFPEYSNSLSANIGLSEAKNFVEYIFNKIA